GFSASVSRLIAFMVSNLRSLAFIISPFTRTVYSVVRTAALSCNPSSQEKGSMCLEHLLSRLNFDLISGGPVVTVDQDPHSKTLADLTAEAERLRAQAGELVRKFGFQDEHGQQAGTCKSDESNRRLAVEKILNY